MSRRFRNYPGYRKVSGPLIFFLSLLAIYIILKAWVLSPSANQLTYVNSNQSVLGLNIPSNLHFCGEKIPSNDFEIRKDIEREFFSNSYWKNNSVILFHRAQRWFPYIEPILKQEGIPDDFKYVAVIESHLSNVNSPAGAAGFWQLVPVTAGGLGLEVSSYVDERYDVEKSTRAACQLIRQAYKVFRNWTLAAAAYNRGIGGILKAMKTQKSNNYYDLMLNPETGSFVYRILAYKTLFSSPEHFGIRKRKWNYLPRIQYKTFVVDTALTTLDGLATVAGTTPGTIRSFNPWLRQNSLPASGRKYEIRIPKKMGDYSGYVADLLPEADLPLKNETVPAGLQKPDTLAKAHATMTP